MLDVKKLITGFLVLATVTASLALVLSDRKLFSSQSIAPISVATDTAVSLANQNAFVPMSANAPVANGPAIAVALNDPNNFTTNLTQALLDGAAVANVNGLTQDANGNIEFREPAAGSVATDFAKNPAVRDFQVPNWDAEVAAQKLNIASTVDPQKYSDELNSIIVKNLIQTGASGMVGQNIDQSSMIAVGASVQGAESEIATTPTPARLAAFQKSLVAAMIYEKNMTGLVALAQTDPVKASLVDQAESAKYDQVMSDFNNESERASVKGLLSFGPSAGQKNGTLALLQEYFGIQTANAQWPVFNPVEFGSWIKDEIENILLQILKNTLSAFLQQRVLKLVQGSGAPKFIQQWGTLLTSASAKSAQAASAKVIAGACSNIQSLLQSSLPLSAAGGGVGGVSNCPIPQVSQGQLSNFAKDFNAPGVQNLTEGSWGLYAETLNPSGGNYYATLLNADDAAAEAGDNAQSAAQTKAIANQGYNSDGVCTDNGCDDDSYPSYQSACGDGSTPENGMCDPDSDDPVPATQKLLCDDGTMQVDQATEGDDGICADDSEPEVQTPGQTTLQAQQSALGGSLTLVASANSVVGVLESVGMSLLNSVVQVGLNKVAQLGNKAAGGLLSLAAGQPGTGNAISVSASSSSSAPEQPINSTDQNLPTLPPTQCSPHNPTCSSGPGSQCSGGYFGDEMTFSATGGDGLTYTWAVPNLPSGVSINVSSYSGPMFSPYFTLSSSSIDPVTGLSIVSLPVTIPIIVTGSDNATDTCLAVITQ